MAGMRLRYVAGWMLATCLLVWMQWRTQAHQSDFDATGGDEATHFVTGVMVRDYLVDGRGTSPLHFAERFYVSYPRVAFAIWPPLFHLLAGVWFVAALPSRWNALLLMASLMGAIALLLYWEASRHFSRSWALAGAAVFLCLPLTLETTNFFGADPAVSLLMFAAALAWTRYLVDGETSMAVVFGGLAALALLTKYNAFALALLPPISIALTGKWALVRRPATWLAAGIVMLVAGPWYLFAWRLVTYAAEGVPPDRPAALQANLAALVATLGAAILVTAACSVGRALSYFSGFRSTQERSRHIWHVSLFSFIASVIVFHSLVYPYAQERYLLSCLPPALLLSVSGMVWILNAPRGGQWPAVLAGLAVLLFLGGRVTRESESGIFREVGAYLNGLPSTAGRRLLISAPAAGEGALVAEVAVRETRPSSILLRGSKMLARSSWTGEHYRLVCQTEGDLLPLLDELRVEYVLVDSFGDRPHDRLVQRTMLAAVGEWDLVKSFQRLRTASRRERHCRLYRRARPFARPARDLEIDLFYTLGRSLKGPPAAIPISAP